MPEIVVARVAGETDGVVARAGEQAEGQKADVDQPEGQKAEGDQPEGEKPEGDQPDGEKVEGDQPEGAGEKADGDIEILIVPSQPPPASAPAPAPRPARAQSPAAPAATSTAPAPSRRRCPCTGFRLLIPSASDLTSRGSAGTAPCPWKNDGIVQSVACPAQQQHDDAHES